MCLDQASKVTGYSIFSNKKLIKYGILEANKNEKNAIERMKEMYEKIIELIDDKHPDFIVFEDTQYQNNFSTFQQLSQLQGLIMSKLFEINIGFQLIEPSAWRSFSEIKGRKRVEQKKNTQLFVKEKYNINVSEDEADAIAIGVWAINNIIEN